jgi:hypothetical protein
LKNQVQIFLRSYNGFLCVIPHFSEGCSSKAEKIPLLIDFSFFTSFSI